MECGVRYGVVGELVTTGDAPATQDDPAASLQAKVRKLQPLIQRRRESGKDMAPVGRVIEKLQPLMEQGKFAEAEAVLDEALKLFEDEGAPPATLQDKMQRIQAYARKWARVGKLMEEFQGLMQQGKSAEAEALLDKALKILDGKE